MQVAGPDIAAQLIHDDDAQQLGCAVEALVADEQGPDEDESFRPTRRQRIGEDGAARSVPPSADEDLIDYITTGAHTFVNALATMLRACEQPSMHQTGASGASALQSFRTRPTCLFRS